MSEEELPSYQIEIDTNLVGIDRAEIIGPDGRQVVVYEPTRLSLQDGGKTLKIFTSDPVRIIEPGSDPLDWSDHPTLRGS